MRPSSPGTNAAKIAVACVVLLSASQVVPSVGAAEADRVELRYRELVERSPAEGPVFDRFWKRASETGRTAALLEEYARRADSGDQTARLIHGLMLLRTGRKDDALARFRQAAEADPGDPAPLEAMAAALDASGDPASAARTLREAAGKVEGAARVERLRRAGETYLRADALEDAAACFEQCVVVFPDNLTLRRELAATYLRNDLPEKAVSHLEALAAKGEPESRLDALHKLAAAREVLGDLQGAIRAMTDALGLLGPEHWMRSGIENDLIRLHQRDDSVATLEKSWLADAEKRSKDVAAALRLVRLYRATGDEKDEMRWLETAQQRGSRSREEALRLAFLLSREGFAQRALAAIDALGKEAAQSSEVALARAEVLLRSGDRNGAMRDAARFETAKTAADRLAAKRFYDRNGLNEGLLRMLRAASVEDPGSEEAAFELADHLATVGDVPAARVELQRWLATNPRPEAALRVASFLVDQGDTGGAVLIVNKIDNKQGAQPAIQRAEILQQAGLPAQAQAVLEAAWPEASPKEREEIDRRLFNSLPGLPPQTAGLLDALTGLVSSPDSDSGAAAKRARELAGAATDEPSGIRALRWLLWTGQLDPALALVDRIGGTSAEWMELKVELAARRGEPEAAVTLLREMAGAEKDPRRKSEYLKRAGRTLVERGEAAAGLALFEERRRLSGADGSAMADYANALQAAGRWEEAEAEWRTALATAAQDRRREVARSLASTVERNRGPAAALELMESEMRRERDADRRMEWFQDVLTLAARTGLIEPLRGRLRARLDVRPNDPFLLKAVAELERRAGNEEESYRLLARSLFAPDQSLEDLDPLITASESGGDLSTALRFARLKVRRATDVAEADWKRLAALEETIAGPEAAAEVWNRATESSPGNARLAILAGAFALRTNDNVRAAELGSRAVLADPVSAAGQLLIGAAKFAAGDRSGALAAYRAGAFAPPHETSASVLRLPASIGPAAAQPAPSSMRATASGKAAVSLPQSADTVPLWDAIAHADPESLRLRCIREASFLITPAQAGEWGRQWIASAATDPSGAFWALHFSEQSDGVRKLLEGLAADSEPGSDVNLFVIWMELLSGREREALQWLASAPERADAAPPIIARYLQWNGRENSADRLAEAAFAGGIGSRLALRLALILEAAGYTAAAETVVQNVCDSGPAGLAEAIVHLARMQVYRGREDLARRTLEPGLSLPGGDPGATVYAALHDYTLLLAPSDRAAFLRGQIAEATKAGPPLHAAIVRLLAAAMTVDQSGLDDAAAEIVKMRAAGPSEDWIDGGGGSSAYRYWAFLLVLGGQFQSWQMESAARTLWSHALADEALLRLQGDDVRPVSEELRARLQVGRALSGELRFTEVVQDANAGFRSLLRRQVDSLGLGRVSVLLSRTDLAADPGDATLFRQWTSALSRGGIRPGDAAMLRACLSGSQELPARVPPVDALRVFAEWPLLSPGDFELRRMAALWDGQRGDPVTGLELARQLSAAGARENYAELLRRSLASSPVDAALRVELASQLEKAGKPSESLSLLLAGMEEPGAPRQTLARKAGELVRSGAISRAQFGTLKRLLDNGSREILDDLLLPGAREGKLMELSPLLRYASLTGSQPEGRYAALRLLAMEHGQESVRGEMSAWLAADPSRARDCLPDILESMPGVTVYGWLGRLVKAAQAGDEAAWNDVVLDRDSNPAGLAEAAAWLQRHGHGRMASLALEAACELRPAEAEWQLWQARMIAEAGDLSRAEAILDRLAMRRHFDPQLSARIADTAWGAGIEPDRYLAQAMELMDFARAPGLHARLTRLEMNRGDLRGARERLKRVVANPAADESRLVVDYLYAAGKPTYAELMDLGCRDDVLDAALVELSDRLAKSENWSGLLELAESAPGVLLLPFTSALRPKDDRDRWIGVAERALAMAGSLPPPQTADLAVCLYRAAGGKGMDRVVKLIDFTSPGVASETIRDFPVAGLDPSMARQAYLDAHGNAMTPEETALFR